MTVSAAANRTRQLDCRNATAHRLGRYAIASLHAELVLYPKPGLVSPRDGGAHLDMNAGTFMKSLTSLRHYFVNVAEAGGRTAPLAELRRLGMDAEARMLAATHGINTHRGAIFSLGLLVAAAGHVCSDGHHPTASALRGALGIWRRDLCAVLHTVGTAASHGNWVARIYGAPGALGEARNAFPSVFERALPALQDAIARGADTRGATSHALFILLASVTDTNVLWRGGREALARLQHGAAEFLAAGSVFAPGWVRRASVLHRQCCALGISPGGCADLLCATLFVHNVQSRWRPD
jgi:triphosphoribosyl-dephospho-CoA synthase